MDMPRQFNMRRKRQLGYSLILLAVMLLAWWIWATWFRSPGEEDLPYSAFLEQVQDGNVQAVTITGSQIDGLLFHPLTGPIPLTGGYGSSTNNLSFRTHFPEVVGDPNLVSLLNSDKVQITAKPAGVQWLSTIRHDATSIPLLGFALLLLVVGIIAGRDRLMHGLKRLLPFHHDSPLPYTIETPTETFTALAGQDAAVSALKGFSSQGTLPYRLILAGPAGTGKTLLAKALAGVKGARLITCKPARMIALSVTPDRLHDLFKAAHDSAPCVLLIEGLEAINREHPAVFNQFLYELDRLEAGQDITIVGETQSLENIDPALLRPERFGQALMLDLPDRQAREAVLSLHTRGLRLANNVNLGVIARTTTGFSGSELAGLCAGAERKVQKEGRAQITMADFEEALDHLLIQSPHELLLNEQVRRAVAYHEAGHALAAWYLANATPMQRISILTPAHSFAAISDYSPAQRNGEEQRPEPGSAAYEGTGLGFPAGNLLSKEDLLARLAVMLSGRAAEEIATGDVTISAENDLVEATRLARRMVTRWGMGSLGLMTLDKADPLPGDGAVGSKKWSRTGIPFSQPREISEETAARIDRDVQALLSDRYTAVRKLLEGAREPLDRLVRALLTDETLDQEEINLILGPRPFTISDEANALTTAP